MYTLTYWLDQTVHTLETPTRPEAEAQARLRGQDGAYLERLSEDRQTVLDRHDLRELLGGAVESYTYLPGQGDLPSHGAKG